MKVQARRRIALSVGKWSCDDLILPVKEKIKRIVNMRAQVVLSFRTQSTFPKLSFTLYWRVLMQEQGQSWRGTNSILMSEFALIKVLHSYDAL